MSSPDLNPTSPPSLSFPKVHKETLSKVPNALEGRDDVEKHIFGMEGVPAELLHTGTKRARGEAEVDEGGGAGGGAGAGAPGMPPVPWGAPRPPPGGFASAPTPSAAAAQPPIVAPPFSMPPMPYGMPPPGMMGMGMPPRGFPSSFPAYPGFPPPGMMPSGMMQPGMMLPGMMPPGMIMMGARPQGFLSGGGPPGVGVGDPRSTLPPLPPAPRVGLGAAGGSNVGGLVWTVETESPEELRARAARYSAEVRTAVHDDLEARLAAALA